MPQDALSSLGPAGEFLQDLVQSSGQAVAVFDRNLRYVALNEAHARSNNRPVAAHVGAALESLAPSLAFALSRPLRELFEGGRAVSGRRVLRDSADHPGQLLTWTADLLPVRGAGGMIVGACLILTAPHEAQAQGHSLQNTEALWQVAGQVPQVRSFADVVDLLLNEVVPAAGAHAAGLSLLEEEQQALRVMGASGYDAVTLHTWKSVPLAMPIPATMAVQEARPLFLTFADVESEFPELAQAPTYAGQAHVALPLMQDEVCLGCITLSFADRPPFSGQERSVLVALAGACAQTITRLRLSEAQGEVQRELERNTALLDSLLNHATVAHALFDLKLRFLRLNRPFAAFSGRTVQAHLGQSLGEVLPDWAAVAQALAVSRQTKQAQTFSLQTADEQDGRSLSVSVYPVLSPLGSLVGLGCQVTAATAESVSVVSA
ncbi:PAS domain-containing protein [Deinococcus navajonensis]|uniref:PAS domain-containing protein n=1 Tax=Deinococcus navajonensis TaxID=309884 RepID=A0ABV8XS16_9DEIO